MNVRSRLLSTRVLRRLSVVVLLGGLGLPLIARGATVAAAGLPLFQYTQTSSGSLPWDATPLSDLPASVTVLGTPHTAMTASGTALVVRTSSGGVGIVMPGAGYLDVSSQLDDAPLAAGDPVASQDATGTWNIFWTTAQDHLIWATNTSTESLPGLDEGDVPATVWAWRDLSLDGTLAHGVPAIQGNSVVTRTATGQLNWWQLGTFAQTVTTTDLTAITSVVAGGDPLVWASSTFHAPVIIVTTAAGHLAVLVDATSWTALDATVASASAPFASGISMDILQGTPLIAGLTAGGDVQLLATSLTGTAFSFRAVDATKSANTAAKAAVTPRLTGTPALVVGVNGAIHVAAAALNWGDLFTLAAPSLTGTFVATDVSATGGSQAKTVGGGVAGALTGTNVTWYAGGVATPAPTGTGLYAAPASKWSTAINDGWPIVAVTGGLGTTSSPWVQTTNTPSTSADFQLGATIAASHQRVTWLSFWTVSGPTSSEVTGVAPASLYYNHAYTAGRAVASQIDSYRGAGLGLKPDWVIIDPEGYPDLHSCMDGTAPGAQWCSAASPATWAAYVNGWAAGLTSVDPNLKPGVYASQSEIKNGALGTLGVPVFVATAFTPGLATTLTNTTASGATSLTVTVPPGHAFCDAGLIGGQKLLVGSGSSSQLLTVASGDQPESMTVTLSQPTSFDLPAGTALTAASLPTMHVVTDAPIGSTQIMLSQPHDVCNQGAVKGTVLSGLGQSLIVSAAPTLYLGFPLSSPTPTVLTTGTIIRGFPGPVRYPTTTGANLLGYIAFLSNSGDTCAATSFMRSYFTSSAWGGLYNTIQFSPGVYCKPS